MRSKYQNNFKSSCWFWFDKFLDNFSFTLKLLDLGSVISTLFSAFRHEFHMSKHFQIKLLDLVWLISLQFLIHTQVAGLGFRHFNSFFGFSTWIPYMKTFSNQVAGLGSVSFLTISHSHSSCWTWVLSFQLGFRLFDMMSICQNIFKSSCWTWFGKFLDNFLFTLKLLDLGSVISTLFLAFWPEFQISKHFQIKLLDLVW